MLEVGGGGFLAKCVMTFGHHLCLLREMRLLHPALDLSLLLSRLSRRGTPHILRGPSTKPRLGLYNRVIEGPSRRAGLKEYLCRHTDGHCAAKIRFRFHSGTSMLTHHRADHDYLRAHAHEEACPTCDQAEVVEDVPHVLLCTFSLCKKRTLRPSKGRG